jgi:hypothetical protein
VLVHDRYKNYDAIPGVLHQLCCAHILRDLEDAAQAYPDAIWPGQAADALRALIHATNTPRAQGLAAVRRDTAVDLRLFRNAVASGYPGSRRAPARTQAAADGCWECPWTSGADVLRFLGDLRVPPAQPGRTRPAASEDPAEDRKLRSGPPPTGTWVAATPPPPQNTARTSSPPFPTRPKPLVPPIPHALPCPPAVTQRKQPTRWRWPECRREVSPV